MASPVLDRFEYEAFRASLLTGSATPASSSSPREISAFQDESDYLCESSMDGMNCFKGSLWALGMEAAAALCVFGIWQLWHILR